MGLLVGQTPEVRVVALLAIGRGAEGGWISVVCQHGAGKVSGYPPKKAAKKKKQTKKTKQHKTGAKEGTWRGR